MIITNTTQKQNTNFGYKASFTYKAFKQFSTKMENPLNSYSLAIIKDIDEGMDAFNSQINQREGVPNLYEAKILIDDIKTYHTQKEGTDKILYGFDIQGLPAYLEKYISEDMQFRPEHYYVPVRNGEYKKKEAKPFEKALNKMFDKIKGMIDKYHEIENELKVIKDKHVESPGEWD